MPITLSIEPTLYLRKTVSISSGMRCSLSRSISTPTVSWVIWPIFSSRVRVCRSESILRSILSSARIAGVAMRLPLRVMFSSLRFIIELWYDLISSTDGAVLSSSILTFLMSMSSIRQAGLECSSWAITIAREHGRMWSKYRFSALMELMVPGRPFFHSGEAT